MAPPSSSAWLRTDEQQASTGRRSYRLGGAGSGVDSVCALGRQRRPIPPQRLLGCGAPRKAAGPLAGAPTELADERAIGSEPLERSQHGVRAMRRDEDRSV